METEKLAKQMIDFQRAAFENGYQAMAMLHEGTERMVNMTLDQAAWLPEEGKKAIEEWIEACENGREEFKKLVDENFKRFDRIFIGQRKAKKAASK